MHALSSRWCGAGRSREGEGKALPIPGRVKKVERLMIDKNGIGTRLLHSLEWPMGRRSHGRSKGRERKCSFRAVQVKVAAGERTRQDVTFCAAAPSESRRQKRDDGSSFAAGVLAKT
jgi:hypothetical protein